MLAASTKPGWSSLKLDRLSRNLAFVATLMDSGIEFVAVDNPYANKLTIHILAAVAEHEREAISERTKVAPAAGKARGKSRRHRRTHARDPQGTSGAICGQRPADHSRRLHDDLRAFLRAGHPILIPEDKPGHRSTHASSPFGNTDRTAGMIGIGGPQTGRSQ
jgi:resolvase-like protein